jgi:hypothetical protein
MLLASTLKINGIHQVSRGEKSIPDKRINSRKALR